VRAPFSVLMRINIDTLLGAVDDIIKFLSDHNIKAEVSVWNQYDVDIVEEFSRMYSPLLLPMVGANMYHAFLTQYLRSQLGQVERGQERLE
jgi:hypothetical protein